MLCKVAKYSVIVAPLHLHHSFTSTLFRSFSRRASSPSSPFNMSSTTPSPSAPVPVSTSSLPADIPPGHHLNKYGFVEKTGLLEEANWKHRWDKGFTQWHMEKPHPSLVSALPTLLTKPSSTDSSTPASSRPVVLVPLCGKTIDLLYLAEQGYRVVGVEFVAQPCHEFFAQHKWSDGSYIQYSVERVTDNVTLFREKLDRILIVQSDFFSPHLTPQLISAVDKKDNDSASAGAGADVCWDRASLVAINPCDRLKYIHKVRSLMKVKSATSPNSHNTPEYLLNFFEYDQSKMHGPPFSVPYEQVTSELLASEKAANHIKVLQETVEGFMTVRTLHVTLTQQ